MKSILARLLIGGATSAAGFPMWLWALGLLLLAFAATAGTAVYYKHEYDAEHDKRVAAETNLQTANSATKACNDSIDALERRAREVEVAAAAARSEAQAARKRLAARADRELSTPATTPGNDCKSAQDRVRRILGERRAP